MRRFNLNLYFALDAILHAASLTEACRVNLSQSAMSVALKKLRGYSGDDLIMSQGGVTQLTPLAGALRPCIRQILQGSHEALNLSPASIRKPIDARCV